MNERDMSVKEVAALMQISHVTVWAMIKSGRLPSYSVTHMRGSPRRIKREAVEAIRNGLDPRKMNIEVSA